VAQRHAVGTLAEFPVGCARIVEVAGRSIGVFNVDGMLHALRNVCPHHGAPLCLGSVSGMMLPSDRYRYEYGLDGRILKCPWHGYEFRIEDGRSVVAPETLRVRSYRVDVLEDQVFVYT
jgi:nitrite reductase (NADH) small subunit